MAQMINAHQWEKLSALLHPNFNCRYSHTGEVFDRDDWVRVNADYPGFQNYVLLDCVATAERAVGRARVTALLQGEVKSFEVATFITVRDGLIADMHEVWTDVDGVAPAGARPTADQS